MYGEGLRMRGWRERNMDARYVCMSKGEFHDLVAISNEEYA